ncbi:MAG: exodeoxyribonuclease small subunit [Gaiellales bacterium]|nr:exodeoxyribonuclease small subunit [Gaiellales bacterium]
MNDEITFEQARNELEAIVRRLEDGQTSLDDALQLWERGEQLHELCRAKLDQAEERVAVLLARMAESRAAAPPPPAAAE